MTIGIAGNLEFWKIDILFIYELQITKSARLNNCFEKKDREMLRITYGFYSYNLFLTF